MSKTKAEAAQKTHVYAEDMSDEQLEECVNFAKDAFQQPSGQDKVFSAIARNIRMNLDKADPRGTGWNCIVGTKFGAYVTHEIKTYAYFSVAHGVSVLVWRA